MWRDRIVLLAFALAPWHLAAEPVILMVQVIDSRTSEPVSDARVIVSNGPSAEPSSAEMVQKNRQFQPNSLVITSGSEVNFPNRDNTQHHVYSFSPARVFNLELFADQPEAPVTFNQVGIVEVGCNIHDQMQGFILVTDSPLHARTDSSGLATISLAGDAASADRLDVKVWHPRLKNALETVDFTLNASNRKPMELVIDLVPERRKAGRLDGLQQRFQDL